MKRKEEEMSQAIDDFRDRRKNKNNLSLAGYSSTQARPQMKVQIIKGDDVLAEYDPASGKPFFKRDNTKVIQMGIQMAERERNARNQMMEYMHSRAVERELDNEDIIEFFNHGINLVHHRDKEMEWEKIIRNSKRLYDSEEFKRRLIENYGSPQDKLRYAREKERESKRKAAARKEEENGIIRGDKLSIFDSMNRDVASGIKIDPENGTITLTVPDHIRTGEPLFKDSEYAKEYKEKMSDINNKVDDFLEEFTVSKYQINSAIGQTTYIPGVTPIGNYALTGPSINSYEDHYRRCRERFMREVNSL